ncbi:MAG: hypothetical protein AAFX44_20050 [Pseudomonadota bacterium]
MRPAAGKSILAVFGLVPIVIGWTAACALLSQEKFVDTHTDASGKLVLTDTQRNWEEFVAIVNSRVNDEKGGAPPEGGVETWTEFWKLRIQALQKNQENAQKYVQYIIDRRRQYDLPAME